MNIYDRIKLLRTMAQTAPASGTTGTGTNTAQPVAVQTIDVRSVPNFRPTLFSARPDLIDDINKIINVLNTNMSKLTSGKINFNLVWNDPSISGDAFSNSVKNMVIISKWIYNVIRAQTAAYSIDGLRAFAINLVKTVQSYSFPEASQVQTELINMGHSILAKLGNGQV